MKTEFRRREIVVTEMLEEFERLRLYEAGELKAAASKLSISGVGVVNRSLNFRQGFSTR